MSGWAADPDDAPQPLPLNAPAPAPQPPLRTALAGLGLPHDRHTRTAARRTLATLKAQFQRVLRALPPTQAARLHEVVQQARDPFDLAALRHEVLGLLQNEGLAAQRHARELEAALDQAFPAGGQLLPFGLHV